MDQVSDPRLRLETRRAAETTNARLRGSGEGWASALESRRIHRSFFGLLFFGLPPPSSRPASFGKSARRVSADQRTILVDLSMDNKPKPGPKGPGRKRSIDAIARRAQRPAGQAHRVGSGCYKAQTELDKRKAKVVTLEAKVVRQSKTLRAEAAKFYEKKKIDVENNGVSPDNGKTRLNPTNAHTQGVSGAAGSRFLFFSKCSV